MPAVAAVLLLLPPGVAPSFAWLGTHRPPPVPTPRFSSRAATCVRCQQAVDNAKQPKGGKKGVEPRGKVSLKVRKGRGSGKNWKVVGLHRQAQSAIKVGQYDEARELLREGLRLDERDGYTWLSLARLEARVGEVHEARDLFERATSTCPDNVRLIHARAVFEQKSGRPSEARSLFQQAADLEPSNAYVSHAWGLLEESVGNASAAQTIYSDLVAVKPQSQVCGAWASLEAREGNLQHAREIYLQGWGLYDLGEWYTDEPEAAPLMAAAEAAKKGKLDVKADEALQMAPESEVPSPHATALGDTWHALLTRHRP